MLYCHLQHHNDTIIKTHAGRLLKQNMYLSLYCKGSKRLFKVCVWEGAGDRTELKYFDPHSYGRQRCVFLVLLMLNLRPWGQLCWVLAFFTASYQQLLWSPNSIWVPEGPLSRVLLSLPHLDYNPAPTVTATVTETWTQLSCLLSWLSYIIVQGPLDLWNCMFNRHQAEITVMQFRGHSLLVRQSMRVSWDFLACPILLANFHPRDFLS